MAKILKICQRIISNFKNKILRNWQVKEIGLHVNTAFMFLTASPDDLVICVWHQPAMLEVKMEHR